MAAPAFEKPRTLGEIVSSQQQRDKAGYFQWISRSIGVQEHDDISGGSRQPRFYCIALSSPDLFDNTDRRHQSPSYCYRLIARMAIHEQNFVDGGRDMRQDIKQVRSLVARRDNDTDTWAL